MLENELALFSRSVGSVDKHKRRVIATCALQVDRRTVCLSGRALVMYSTSPALKSPGLTRKQVIEEITIPSR